MPALRIIQTTRHAWGVRHNLQHQGKSMDDITGKRYGRWIVIAQADAYVSPKGRRQPRWLAACDCGTQRVVRASDVISGKSRSCGCLSIDVAIERLTTHGRTHEPAFRSWRAMIDRCTNPKNNGWSTYGGKGIYVCERWMTLENFIEDMGPRPPGTSIDRIDGSKGYEPGNCRWATPAEQGRNTKRNTCNVEIAERARELVASGVTKADAARALGLHPETVRGIVNGTRWKV